MKQILFNTEMVRAIQSGRKTQTRRAVKSHLDINKDCQFRKRLSCGDFDFGNDNYYTLVEPRYKEGDILWVREPARVENHFLNSKDNYQHYMKFRYLSDDEVHTIKTPQRFRHLYNGSVVTAKWIENCKGVPNGCIKEMARTFLKVINVKVERLNDITIDEVKKEGFATKYKGSKDNFIPTNNPFDWWIDLWNSTSKNGYKWEDNPYVFVYEFTVIKKEDN